VGLEGLRQTIALMSCVQYLVGFGYPWALVAPILIAMGIPDLDAIRVAAIANNAPPSGGLRRAAWHAPWGARRERRA